MSGRCEGTCKWFSASKGYGFITNTATTEDLFVHHSAIKGDGFKTLGEGEAVEFDVETDESGRKKAVNVSGPNGSAVVGDQRAPRGDFGGGRGGGYGGYERSYGGRDNYSGGRGGYRDSGYGGGREGGYGGRSYGGGRDGGYSGGRDGGYSGGSYQGGNRYNDEGGSYRSGRY